MPAATKKVTTPRNTNIHFRELMIEQLVRTDLPHAKAGGVADALIDKFGLTSANIAWVKEAIDQVKANMPNDEGSSPGWKM